MAPKYSNSGFAISSSVPTRQSRYVVAPLEVQRDLGGHRPRGHVVGSAERRQEVVERVFVGDVDRGQVEVHLVMVSVEQVVLAYGRIEEVARLDARRVVIVVAGAGSWNLQKT